MELDWLLKTIAEDVVVWIAIVGDDNAVYFNEAGLCPIGIAKKYNVVEIYPEYYGAISCTGITIIVKERKE